MFYMKYDVLFIKEAISNPNMYTRDTLLKTCVILVSVFKRNKDILSVMNVLNSCVIGRFEKFLYSTLFSIASITVSDSRWIV